MVTSKWLYKIEHVSDGSIYKYKEICVVRRPSQQEGIDYEETFAPIERYTIIRSLFSLIALNGWNIHQMDVKTTFLNGIIVEEVYIEKTLEIEAEYRDTYVFRLK